MAARARLRPPRRRPPASTSCTTAIPGLDNARPRRRRCCTRGRPARRPSRCAPARGDARRRRIRDPHPEGAVSAVRPARTSARARSRLFLAAQAEIEGAHPRRQRGRAVEEGVVHRRVERAVQGHVEYRPNSTLLDVDAATTTAKLEFEDVHADVLNVIPPQRAGAIARELGMANANGRFCQVDFLTLRIDGAAEHPRAGRRDPARAADAEVRTHGEPARQGVRGRDRRAAVGRARGECRRR